MILENCDGEKSLQPGTQARGGTACDGRCVTVAQATKDPDVPTTVLRSWGQEFGSSGPDAFASKGKMKSADEEPV